jgi:hypothetical protein
MLPSTCRIRPALARYLLEQRDDELWRRLTVLAATPFPPGSHALDTGAMWQSLVRRFHGRRAFAYGDGRRAVVYTYTRMSRIMAEAVIVDGVLRP